MTQTPPTLPDEPPLADETAPLLADASNAASGPTQGPGTPAAPASSTHAPGDLPKVQVALLCFARIIEPIAFFSVFPYISQMVQDNGGVADTDVGFYSGIIESLFSLTQALVMLAWGRAADRVGRKPVLVLSLVGMASATALFGMARTLGQMVAFRCLAGVFSGTIVTIRTMLAEHSTPATQARVFSWFAFSGNLGIFVGPLLGGALADPLRSHGVAHPLTSSTSSTSSTILSFFEAYPYALPGFVVAGLGYLAALSSALLVDETLVRTPHAPHAPRAPPAPSSTRLVEETTTAADGHGHGHDRSVWGLLAAPGVAAVLYNYAHAMLLAFAYTAIMPVFWFTPVALGGFGLSPLQISGMMGLSGIGQAAWLLFVFPPLQHRVGTNGVMRLCALAYPPFMAVSPLGSLLLRYGDHALVFWAVVPPLLVLGSGVSMSFTAIQLAVNDIAPSPHVLGTLNALALTGVSAIRAFAPALFTSLFAVSVRSQLLGGYAIWLLMVLVALGFTAAARRLPDYAAIKRQRDEQARITEQFVFGLLLTGQPAPALLLLHRALFHMRPSNDKRPDSAAQSCIVPFKQSPVQSTLSTPFDPPPRTVTCRLYRDKTYLYVDPPSYRRETIRRRVIGVVPAHAQVVVQRRPVAAPLVVDTRSSSSRASSVSSASSRSSCSSCSASSVSSRSSASRSSLSSAPSYTVPPVVAQRSVNVVAVDAKDRSGRAHDCIRVEHERPAPAYTRHVHEHSTVKSPRKYTYVDALPPRLLPRRDSWTADRIVVLEHKGRHHEYHY